MPVAAHDEAAALELFARSDMQRASVQDLYDSVHHIVSHQWTNGTASLQAQFGNVSAPLDSLFSASAREEDGDVLVSITCRGRVEAGQTFLLALPSTLVLPAAGFGPTHNFSIAVKGAVVQTAPDAFAAAPSVGHFQTSSITYTPAGREKLFAGEVVVLRVSFSLNAEILSGETVYLHLPGFRQVLSLTPPRLFRCGTEVFFLKHLLIPPLLRQVAGHTCSQPTRLAELAVEANASNASWPAHAAGSFRTLDPVFHKFLTGSWDAERSRLTLRAAALVLAHEHHTVIVPCEAGIALTKGGLSTNDARLQIGASAAAGLVAGERIEASPQVEAVCGPECGGIFAARLQMRVGAADDGGQPVLPSSCPSIEAFVAGECTCGCEEQKLGAGCSPCIE